MFAYADSRQAINTTRLLVVMLLSVSVSVAGCGARKGVLLPEIDSWETRTIVLGALEDWEFSGRIAVKAADDGFNARLRWSQDDDAFAATVGGPLGIGTVRIKGDGDKVVLIDKDGVRSELSNVEVELQYRYGWTIPVTSLRYWALGIPDPSLPAETAFDDDGRLARIEQDDWTVAILRYRDGGGQAMPFRLTASNADTRVRIVIDKWRFFD